MSTDELNESLFLLDQRYYNFVLVASEGRLESTQLELDYLTYLKDLSEDLNSKVTCDRVSESVKSIKFVSNIPFTRGDIQESLSVFGDKSAPYHYDIFIIKCSLEGRTFYAFAYPFISLAVMIVKGFIRFSDSFRGYDFVKVDLAKLIELNQLNYETKGFFFKSHLVSLELTVSNDPLLSGMILKGDRPLDSTIYTDKIAQSVKGGEYNAQKCVISCEQGGGGCCGKATGKALGKKIRSHIHIDMMGNFRTYVHMTASNLEIFGSLIYVLEFFGCLRKSGENPLVKSSLEIIE